LLIFLVRKLEQKQLKSVRRIVKITNHWLNLAEYHASIEHSVDICQIVLKYSKGRLIYHEISIAPVVVVEQDGRWGIFAYNFRNFCDLLSLNLDSLNILNLFSIGTVKTNIDHLLTEDLVCIVSVRSLQNFERLVFAIFYFILSLNCVTAFCLEPDTSPFSKVEILVSFRLTVIISLLECSDEIRKFRVTPLVLVEIDLEAICEFLPSHVENQLLHHAWTFTIGNTIN
jgi:hypothetical protein